MVYVTQISDLKIVKHNVLLACEFSIFVNIKIPILIVNDIEKSTESSPGKTTKIIQERHGVLKENNLRPGDETFIDHFYSSVKGRLFHSKGKTIAVDQASNYVFIECQKRLTSHETLIAKENYEKHCKDHGVIPQ